MSWNRRQNNLNGGADPAPPRYHQVRFGHYRDRCTRSDPFRTQDDDIPAANSTPSPIRRGIRSDPPWVESRVLQDNLPQDSATTTPRFVRTFEENRTTEKYREGGRVLRVEENMRIEHRVAGGSRHEPLEIYHSRRHVMQYERRRDHHRRSYASENDGNATADDRALDPGIGQLRLKSHTAPIRHGRSATKRPEYGGTRARLPYRTPESAREGHTEDPDDGFDDGLRDGSWIGIRNGHGGYY